MRADESVAAPRPMVPPQPVVPRKRVRRRNAVALLVLVALVAAVAVGTALYRLPYYTLGPGSVRPTGGLISVAGGTTYPPSKGVDFTTVSVNGPLTIWGALAGWLDSEKEVVNEDVILQGRTPQESEQVNLQQMDDSKDTATKVALDFLGLAEMAGAEIVAVVPGSPAEQVLHAGDVVASIDGAAVRSSSDLVRAIGAHKPGDQVRLGVRRGAATSPTGGSGSSSGSAGSSLPPVEDVTAVLTSNPDQPGQPFFGVQVRSWFQIDYPHTISIDSGQVGGPSAGLAFTLGLIDDLTPGDLTGGTSVAATGTIAPDGTIGPIGGLDHKVDAVRHAGVHVFIVPDSQSPTELAKARARAKGKVEIVPVHTLGDALAAIASHGGQAPGSLQLPATLAAPTG